MKILAIDIGGTAIKYGVVNENFEVCEFFEIATDAHLGGPHLMNKILNIVDTYIAEISCVGISTAGQVNSKEGKIIFASENIPYYTGTEIQKNINAKYPNLPVSVENDVNSAATAEAIFGSGKDVGDFLCLTYGTGVGGAMWLNGKIYSGHKFSAGEFGHIVTHTGGRRCTCGNVGCYEAYASTTALTKAVKHATGRDLNGREIFSKENFANPEIRIVIDRWIEEIIGGLTTLIFIFNPACIVLGGGIMNEDYVISEIRKRISSRNMDCFKSVHIEKAKLKNQAGMLGASYLAKQKYDAKVI
ncbi:MAG: ROK family protein [Oscillospiraceae bacterium]